MGDIFDFGSSNKSQHDFYDEQLIALEESGKTLEKIQAIVIPWGDEKTQNPVTVDGKEVPIYPSYF
jgi:hypothetical protein